MDDMESAPPSGETRRNLSLVGRVKAILSHPNEEWPRIADEPATIGGIYRSYAMPLAAIQPLAIFIGVSMFGADLGFVHVRLPLFINLIQAIIQFGLNLAMVYAVSLVINGLARNFGGTGNPVAAFKVAAYSATAGWIAGILNLFPPLAMVAIVGFLYSLYLFWLGLPLLMRVPDERAIGYTMTTIAVSILLSWMAFVILSTAMQPLMDYGVTRGVAGLRTTFGVPGVGDVDLGKLDAASKQMQGEVAAARAGTTKTVPSAQLQAMLPGAIGGFERTTISSASADISGLGGSNAEGTYKDGGKEFRLAVADLGAAAAIAGLGSALKVNAQRQDENGYEKAATVDGRFTTEKWNQKSGRGEYSVIVANHFLVRASGEAPIETLKLAVASVDLARLESLARL